MVYDLCDWCLREPFRDTEIYENIRCGVVRIENKCSFYLRLCQIWNFRHSNGHVQNGNIIERSEYKKKD